MATIKMSLYNKTNVGTKAISNEEIQMTLVSARNLMSRRKKSINQTGFLNEKFALNGSTKAEDKEQFTFGGPRMSEPSYETDSLLWKQRDRSCPKSSGLQKAIDLTKSAEKIFELAAKKRLSFDCFLADQQLKSDLLFEIQEMEMSKKKIRLSQGIFQDRKIQDSL